LMVFNATFNNISFISWRCKRNSHELMQTGKKEKRKQKTRK